MELKKAQEQLMTAKKLPKVLRNTLVVKGELFTTPSEDELIIPESADEKITEQNATLEVIRVADGVTSVKKGDRITVMSELKYYFIYEDAMHGVCAESDIIAIW